jgi:voltage-gated potassium channel
MSARFLNEDLFIVARAESDGAKGKLLRAGASRVISPYVIGGHRVAQAVLRPNAMDFIELATRSAHLELQIEETVLREGSELIGDSLKTSPIKSELGIIIVAIKKPDGKMLFNPGPESTLESGDVLITLGPARPPGVARRRRSLSNLLECRPSRPSGSRVIAPTSRPVSSCSVPSGG